MFRRPPHWLSSLPLRCYSTASEPKVPVALIAQIRKQTHVSLSKARSALAASNNDIPAALQWLQKDMESSGAAKATKVSNRTTSEGLISLSVLGKGAGIDTAGGVRAALVELNCETDFVGRNELFGKLAEGIAHTAAFISEASVGEASGRVRFTPLSVEALREAPLISSSDPSAPPQGTIASAIRDTIVKVGENITLRRATAVVEDLAHIPPNANKSHAARRIGSYVHGAQTHTPMSGQIATLALLQLRSPQLAQLILQEEFRASLGTLERSIARQITGFETRSIRPTSENEVDEQALYKQSFITFAGELNGQSVEDVLKSWSVKEGLVASESEVDASGGVDVLDFVKWRVGEET